MLGSPTFPIHVRSYVANARHEQPPADLRSGPRSFRQRCARVGCTSRGRRSRLRFPTRAHGEERSAESDCGQGCGEEIDGSHGIRQLRLEPCSRRHEQYGVIQATRGPSNQRLFDQGAACRIRVAKLAQRVGLTVREIADLFADLPPDPQPADWRRIADSLVEEAQRRTNDLKNQLEGLASGARLCELGPALA